MNIKISIPAKYIEPSVEKLKEFIGIENIGKVYIAGDWNNWADSPEKAGCVRPDLRWEMKKENNSYTIILDLPIGLHGFKPVVIKTTADEKGMVPAIWIAYPQEKVPGYEPEEEDFPRNWLVKIKPE